MNRLLVSIAVIVTAAGCANSPGAPQGPLEIRGSLVQLNRTGLPANGEMVFVLQQGADAPRTVDERRFALGGSDSTVPFALTVERAQLDAPPPYTLRSTIVADGKTVWVGDPVAIDTRLVRANAGPVPLTPGPR